MAREKVDSGAHADGRRYEVEHQVFHFSPPGSANSHLPIRRRAYRLLLEQPDGSLAVAGRAKTKDRLIADLADAAGTPDEG